MSLSLPARRGPRPTTTDRIPHKQVSDNPGEALFAAMKARFLAMAGTEVAPSRISVPGATALFLPACAACNPAAFMVDREFAHIHPAEDGSFRMVLGEADCAEVLDKGWGELHPYARTGRIQRTVAMVYAPRDEAEIEVILRIAAASRACAVGEEAMAAADSA